MKLSYCVVNTNGRDHLLACLDAIVRTHPARVEAEILVLDNASSDGSANAVREWIARARVPGGETGGAERGRPDHPAETRVIALGKRTGKAANDSRVLREARGEFALLLNEDTELCPGASAALLAALEARPFAAAAGAQLLDSAGARQACAWRLQGLLSALYGAVFAHRRLIVQGGGSEPSQVGWVQSAAMLVRRSAAAQVGWLDPDFFVYSDETDFAKRLGDAGWAILHVPAARAVHHEQLASDLPGERRRIVEFHRGRELYMRKHHSRAVAAIVRVLGAWPYLVRALAAIPLPGHDPRRYLLHARAALHPDRAEGLREAAEAHNRSLHP